MVDSRFFSAVKPVKFKSPQIFKMSDCILVKCITWLEAPLDYLIDNKFTEFINEKSRRTRKPSTRKNS